MTSSIYGKKCHSKSAQNLLSFLRWFETPPLEQIAIPMWKSEQQWIAKNIYIAEYPCMASRILDKVDLETEWIGIV